MSKEFLRLPGLVDSHVHLREPGATQKEDFETGTKAAIAGGYTTVSDMPNNPEPTISPEALEKKMILAGNRIYCDVGFYLGATAESSQYFEGIVDEVLGLKVYMTHTTGPLLVDKEGNRWLVFKKWPKGKPILVHLEGEETLETAINLASHFGQRLHVCHVGTKREIELIKTAKENGLPVTCEVTPHHLFLTEADLERLGPFGLMRPPLATEEDRLALWRNLELGVIDMIATDHAPHTLEEKLSEKPPFGVPGLETSLPLLLTAVAEKRLTLDKVVELASTNPRKIFGISGDPNSYTEVYLKESYLINAANLKTKCGWTPFEGMRVTGRVRRVVLRGEIVFDGENIKEPAKGKVIYSNV